MSKREPKGSAGNTPLLILPIVKRNKHRGEPLCLIIMVSKISHLVN